MDVDLAIRMWEGRGQCQVRTSPGHRGHKGRLERSGPSLVQPAGDLLSHEHSAEMKTLLLTFVLLSLVAALQAQDPLSPQPEELDLTGTWYTKALVSNMTLPEGKTFKVVFPLTVTARGGGDLEARITFLIKGQCHVKEILMQKTEEPGKYSAFEGKKLIYVEELPVQDHYIFYCEKQGPGKTFGMGKLMGRTPEENPKALEEFRKFAQRKRLPQEKIVIPEQRESCMPNHD